MDRELLYNFREFAGNKRAYFYDANFNLIKNEAGNTYFQLNGDNPHGGAFDGSSYFVYCYGSGNDEIRQYDIATGTHIGTFDLGYNASGYCIEYANGCFYTIASDGYLYCWTFDGNSFTQKWTRDISGTIGVHSMQGLTFDGQYLWMCYHDDTNIYKFDLDGNYLASK